MKTLSVRVVGALKGSRLVAAVMDSLVALAVALASPPFKAYTRIGAGRLPRSTRLLRRLGVFPIRDHYYQPLFNDARLRFPLSDPRPLPGIDWRMPDQLKFLTDLDYVSELTGLNWQRPATSPSEFCVANRSFGPGDADFLYSFVRQTRPKRVVEVGSGYSTKVVAVALAKNEDELGISAEHTCIEPYEMPWLDSSGPKVIRRLVEEVDMSVFTSLDAGDLLFIDSSHVIRPQGDVLFEYLQVLPSLRAGVNIHIHDIFSPRDYPDAWVREKVLMWNEQYLLEALLTNSNRYEVVAALNLLKHDHYPELSEKLPYLTSQDEPGSIYLRVRSRSEQ